jgi:SAM-dependent methyltransferase
MSIPPAPSADSWAQDDNPRHYDAFAREYPNYSQTSRDLIAHAQPSTDAVAVDLACGTGITTREILAVLGPHGQVTGVDKSAAMLKVAASSVSDPRASWIQARAETVDQHVPGPADVVICNSAIWQTEVAATAMAVRAVLRKGGRFAFNVPAGFLEDDEHQGGQQPAGRYPLLLAEMRAIAERDYGWTPPEPAAPAHPRQRLTRDSIRRSLTEAGFSVEHATTVTHQDTAESQRAWLSIPIFTKDPLPGLPYELRLQLLDKACERLGPGQAEQEQWVVFAARRL